MQGLTFTAAQARLLVAGQLDIIFWPIQEVLGGKPNLRPDSIASFLRLGRNRRWAAFDESGSVLRTILAPALDGETVYLAEPWTLTGGTIEYEADAPNGWWHQRFWAPPHIMPATASRERLDVVNVHPERLQQVTDADMLRAGVPGRPVGRFGYLRDRFAVAWDAQYGSEPGCAWSDNPWIWRIEFTIHQHQEEKKAHA